MQDERENMKSHIITKEIEFIVKMLLKNKFPGLDGFTVSSTKHLKKKQRPILHNSFLKYKRHFSAYFMKTVLF